MTKVSKKEILKSIVFAVVTLFLCYLVYNFFYEIYMVTERITGGFLKLEILPEFQGQWLGVNTLITLLEIRFVLAIFLLFFWLFLSKSVLKWW